MTRRGHAGGMARYDLLDENLTDCLLQAEVVRACLCQQACPLALPRGVDGSGRKRCRVVEVEMERSRIFAEAGGTQTSLLSLSQAR